MQSLIAYSNSSGTLVYTKDPRDLRFYVMLYGGDQCLTGSNDDNWDSEKNELVYLRIHMVIRRWGKFVP